jgi:hypothetical protein
MDAFVNDENFVWAVVMAGSGRFLGRVKGDKGSVLEDIGKGAPIRLDNACELPFPAQLGPQGYMKIPVAVPIDLTVDAVPIYLSRVSTIYFIHDMSKEDQGLLLKIRNNLDENLKRQRAERSGIVLG